MWKFKCLQWSLVFPIGIKGMVWSANIQYKRINKERYLIETIGLFAHRFELDIDCEDFEVVQQKNENQKIKKTLLCKFLKADIPDKDIYLVDPEKVKPTLF